MLVQRFLSGDPGRSSKVYLAIGVVSLAKAIALRKDSTRFKRELLDAGLFLGVGIALHKYSQVKSEKQAELEERVPTWLRDAVVEEGSGSGIRDLASNRFGGSEPEPEPSVRQRAKDALSSRR